MPHVTLQVIRFLVKMRSTIWLVPTLLFACFEQLGKDESMQSSALWILWNLLLFWLSKVSQVLDGTKYILASKIHFQSHKIRGCSSPLLGKQIFPLSLCFKNELYMP